MGGDDRMRRGDQGVTVFFVIVGTLALLACGAAVSVAEWLF